ncbi:hypothetical protein CCACVL1_25368 [Corchorus capsularis]|uniref:Uncharacterized protein n=1 Tax=Corchorus capsularis TaxID=210143 RepID=A0A1R3GKY9_COCAP|nr:hypothetical protein CCACVL1_25368 [Corchorus capsularis]
MAPTAISSDRLRSVAELGAAAGIDAK